MSVCSYPLLFSNIMVHALFSSFHHSKEPIWVSGCCWLPINGVLSSLVGGIRAPSSYVEYSAILLLQGHNQTAGAYVCVLYVWCMFVHVYMCACIYVDVFLCIHVHVCSLPLCIDVRTVFTVLYCSSCLVNCSGGSMFSCWACNC